MKKTFFITLLLFLTSCVQKVANPELSDEIYKDLLAELDIASKSLESEEKNLDSVKKEVELVVPQTGQIKFSRKKVYDAEERVNSLRQQKLYFQIKVEERLNFVRARHEESQRAGGRPWPDKKEIELYKAVVKFNRDKIAWEKARGMKKSVPRGTDAGSKEKDGAKH